jgi:hypothetical protein
MSTNNVWERIILPDYSLQAAPGHELIDLRTLGIMPVMMGGAPGFNAEADIPATTSDGVNINQIWQDYQRILQLYRDWRDPLISLLTFNITASWEQIGASGSQSSFEEASEYGEPVGIRVQAVPYIRGYEHKWYDLAARYTWRFLLKATQAQLDAIQNVALEADSRLLFDRVMRTVFNSTNKINAEGQVVHKFWNGVDVGGETPLTYKLTTFTATHNHYLASNTVGSVLVPNGVRTSEGAAKNTEGVENMYEHLRHHGYSLDNGYRIILMLNSQESARVRTWRANVQPTGIATTESKVATYDFIPAVGQPGLLIGPDVTAPSLGIRQVSANAVPGLNTIGSYGNILIVEDDMVPAGYPFMFATGGTDNLNNPVAIRSDPRLQGMQLVKGRTPDYPLIDSFYTHGLGAGIRNKGAGVVLKLDTDTTYEPPAAYATP